MNNKKVFKIYLILFVLKEQIISFFLYFLSKVKQIINVLLFKVAASFFVLFFFGFFGFCLFYYRLQFSVFFNLITDGGAASFKLMNRTVHCNLNYLLLRYLSIYIYIYIYIIRNSWNFDTDPNKIYNFDIFLYWST